MSEPVTVRILDREYTVGVSDEERAGLAAAARMLDARMRDLRGGNKLVAPDRLAVLTALNLAHELQQAQSGPSTDAGNALALIDAANHKLDALLAAAP
ncbi:MAG: cell division protein ZapA [Thermomonas sp.]|uniref:cell division protein ZapA n=1 Tax=Thermomonas sp. TaxID=1971895 RepID=UPI002611693D|nr:cell division protein ZapA [Thermomonas sp.]MCC7095972.1 cell division protein ZapA [Thermomonas sp.]